MNKQTLKLTTNHLFLITLAILGTTLSNGAYAETSKGTAAKEYLLEVNGQQAQQVSLNKQRKTWEKELLAKIKADEKKVKAVLTDELAKRKALKVSFPAPY